MRIGDLSQPQPDLVLAHLRDDYYSSRHPRPQDVFLVVEVADSSLTFDRGVKARLYATAGVMEYWIVDVSAGSVECYRSPGPGGYGDVQRHDRGERLSLVAFPEVALAVEDIVGPAET